MKLKEKDYRIEDDGIWISRKALEEVRDCYREICKEHVKGENSLDWSAGVDLGKRDILNDILKCFNENLIVKNNPNKLMVLCSYNRDGGDGKVELVVSKHVYDTDKEKVREALEGLWNFDLYDESDLNELRECIDDLLNHQVGYFGGEYVWEEKDALL